MQPVMDLCYSRQQVDRREPTPRLSLGDHMRAWLKRNRPGAMRLPRLATQYPAQYGAPNLGPGCAGC
jgi:hypothetical protein